MSNNNLDFLNDLNPDEVSDPTVNDAPLYRREFKGFFCGEATFARGELKVQAPGTDNEKKWMEVYYVIPAEAKDNDGNDAIKVSFNFPKALKPAAITLVRLGVDKQAVKNGLIDATPESFEENVISALESIGTARMLQVPNAVKGNGGKRYPKLEVYTEAGFEALKEQFGGKLPTADDFDIAPNPSDIGAAGDDVYDV